MRSQSGVTLAALVTTIIVLVILLSITLSYGLGTLQDARENNYKAEVEIVAQAVAEQYVKIVEMGMANLTTAQTSTQPGIFVGTRVTSIPPQMKMSSSLGSTNKYSQFYYRLTSEDLHKLKVMAKGSLDNSTSTIQDTYLVNYYTGEVLNEKRNTYYVGLRNGTSGSVTQQEREGTTTTFNN